MNALFDSSPPLRRQPRKSKRVVFRREYDKFHQRHEYVIYVDGKRVGWIVYQPQPLQHRQGEKWELRGEPGIVLPCRWNYTLREAKDNAIWYFGGEKE